MAQDRTGGTRRHGTTLHVHRHLAGSACTVLGCRADIAASDSRSAVARSATEEHAQGLPILLAVGCARPAIPASVRSTSRPAADAWRLLPLPPASPPADRRRTSREPPRVPNWLRFPPL